MQRYSILWADDEIDLLKPHILFLTAKGYDITPVNNGADAVEKSAEQHFDLVFLDENMPGISGLEALYQIKQNKPNLPVVMITKSEEEQIMEDAIGGKIADYLIKPINPNQILISIKKILDNKRLISEKTNMNYQQDFRNLAMVYNDRIDHHEWIEIYKKLIFWELEIDKTAGKNMAEVIVMQKDEANSNFAKFIDENYEDWLNNPNADRPLNSSQIMRKKVFPLLEDPKEAPLFFVLIDNLRFDQWRILQPLIEQYFTVEEETAYYSILPTTTAYARNAIFAGLMPAEIARQHPELWVSDEEEDGKNNFEDQLLGKNLMRNKLGHLRFSYNKILSTQQGKDLADRVHSLWNNQLNVIVYNFVDMLSHARTDLAMIRELAPDESAYRSITQSWFLHSPLHDIIRRIADKKGRLIITTDHGTIRVKRPYKIVGDRNVNTNLRYKQGKNLGFEEGNGVMVCRKPDRIHLPKPNVSTAYVFATSDHFFAYPNNYNHYVNMYKDTFQHGGLSLEEMIIPYITLSPKS